MPRGIKQGNYYERELGEVYAKCPKSVLAAIAVSALTCGGDYLEQAQARVLDEWGVLHRAGIVPQAPPAGLTPEREAEEW